MFFFKVNVRTAEILHNSNTIEFENKINRKANHHQHLTPSKKKKQRQCTQHVVSKACLELKQTYFFVLQIE